ncbi:ribosome hibernation-promoting factor, HPF/YfiA family [Tepidicaulis sp. LMO-SS28]|uniref:ribosome hibernation-promoting factor, HPF/YfiA family n=1 Tax=Tepidicaulis sp. LMO-SS28 TaxID=3447455 RepID=UPI003EE27CFD
MQLQVTGIHIDVGDALRTHVSDRMSAGIGKYFDRPVDAQVIFQKEGFGFRAECTVHLSSGLTLHTRGEAPEIYAAFDGGVEKLEKRLRRYKRRLKDHHNTHKDFLPVYDAPTFVIAGENDSAQDQAENEAGEEADEAAPVIIAEGTTKVPALSVSDAVMQMDISDVPFVIFRNGDGGINLVYRRDDGNIGWIDAAEKQPESD